MSVNKVLLINPYNPKSDHIQPPLGLGYLAESLKKNDFEVEILDANKNKLNPKSLEKIIKKNKPGAIGLQFYTINFDYIKISLEIIKKINPKIITIVGGPHPSALPEQTMRSFENTLDFAFAGEAEIGLHLLLKKLNSPKNHFSAIPGLIYKKNGEIIQNRPFFSADLDQFGMPSWNLLKPETYPEAQHGAFFEKYPIAQIITSRGCPYDCSFCAGKLSTGKVFRKRSVEKVIEEIYFLYKNHHIREFHIVDDNFTLDKSFAKKILREIIKQNLKASFAVPNGIRLDSIDKEMLLLMKRAGFYLISVGIESGSDRILKLMNKNLMTKEIQKKINLINKCGLDVASFFILGYPGETEKEINKTIEFSLKLDLLRANFFLFLPLPGTRIFNQIFRENKGLMIDYQNVSFTKPSYTDKLLPQKLKSLQRKAFLRFYFLRPNIMLKNLIKIRRPKQIVYLIKRGVNWLF